MDLISEPFIAALKLDPAGNPATLSKVVGLNPIKVVELPMRTYLGLLYLTRNSSSFNFFASSIVFHEIKGGPRKVLAARIEPSRIKKENRSPTTNENTLFFVISKPKVNEWDDGA
jgi:hypothetical protein